jgi:hypothetical protein
MTREVTCGGRFVTWMVEAAVEGSLRMEPFDFVFESG